MGQPQVALMLEILHARGVVAVAGRRERPAAVGSRRALVPAETETVPLREAERLLAEQRFRALGVRLTANGWEAHPDATTDPFPTA